MMANLLGMLWCAVCNEWSVKSLCGECTVLRHSMTLYGKEAVLEKVSQIFVRSGAGLAKQTNAIKRSDAEEALRESGSPGK